MHQPPRDRTGGNQLLIIGGIGAFLLVAVIIGGITSAVRALSGPGTAATPQPAAASTQAAAKPAVKATTAKAQPVKPAPATTAAQKTVKKSSCEPGADLIEWSIAPQTTAIAGAAGSYDSPDCHREGHQSTLDMLRRTSPTGHGYCTLAALASDNPGYEEKYVYGPGSAAPARPKHVVLALGSC
jgi:hypothetical protein